MGRPLLKKAVNYINNNAETLRNFILDGNAEISNNLCEQRMKPIKISLKNCQKIGSDGAAENAAFMHSLIESCRLNNKKTSIISALCSERCEHLLMTSTKGRFYLTDGCRNVKSTIHINFLSDAKSPMKSGIKLICRGVLTTVYIVMLEVVTIFNFCVAFYYSPSKK